MKYIEIAIAYAMGLISVLFRPLYDVVKWIIDKLPLLSRVIVAVLLLFVFVNTALAGVFIPQVFNNQADTTPPAKSVVTNLPLYKGAPSYSFIGENGLVWWIYVGFSAQECVPFQSPMGIVSSAKFGGKAKPL